MSSPFHVMIIGGIGGLCLAQSLKRAGVSVAVYERNPTATDWLQGYRIHINPIGCRALHECLPPELWKTFVAAASKPPAGLGFLTEKMEELVVIGEEFMGGGTRDTIEAHRPISRVALRHILLTGMDDVISFNKTFERYERNADGTVTAFFTDGTSAMGNVLIAADGANSRVRTQYLPHARRIEVGVSGTGGKLMLNEQTRAWLPRQLTTRMNLIMPPGRYSLFTAAFDHMHASTDELNGGQRADKGARLDAELLFDSTQNYVLWAFIARSSVYPANIQDLDGSALQHFVRQVGHRWHPTLQRMVAESDPDGFVLVSFKTSALIEPWESTNVTLMGDAIHNMTPVGGLGANMALRDASLLARKLVTVSCGKESLLTAIRDYEAEMREYGFAAVRETLINTRQATSNRVVREAGKLWFRLCNAVPALKSKLEAKWAEPMSN